MIIRPGDRVRIVTPTFVKRVGYPKTVEDYLPEVDASGEVDELLERFLKLRKQGEWPGRIRRIFNRIRHDLAYLLASKDGFGGPQRTLHTFDAPDLAGRECVVEAVRTVHTGTYRAPYSSRSYEGEYDYAPGGLDDEKRYRLASVDVNSWSVIRGGQMVPLSVTEIEVTNLEKL